MIRIHMTSPFTWISNKSGLNQSSKKSTKVQNLQGSLQSVFNDTFNPEGNRYDWFYYIRQHPLVMNRLNIVNEIDVSLMMPPITNVDLPLLEELRQSLVTLNPDAISYPYSSRCASDIKNLVNDFESCDVEKNDQKSLLKSKFRVKRDIELFIASVKRKLSSANKLTMKQRLLGELSQKWKQQKNIEKIINKISEKVIENETKCKQVLLKLERIFKAKPKWKIKNLSGEPIKNELFENSTVLNGSILLAIEELTKDLKPVQLDIHPVGYKNMLIIPRNTEDLPPKPWNRVPKYGMCMNRIKIDTTKQTNSVALESSWEQYATFDVPEYQNELQKALYGKHGVNLLAKVLIYFDSDSHSIVPDVPWWSNKKEVGVKRSVIDGNVMKNNVGFVWQYKIPTHSRMSLNSAPWVNALEADGEPMQMFNLPKSTSNYAVRLCFVKPNDIVPISNVLYGSDVQRHMKQTIDIKRLTSNPLKLNLFDVKRLTKKARAIMGISDMSRKNSLINEINSTKLTLRNNKAVHDNIVKGLVTSRYWNRFLMKKIYQSKYTSAERQYAQVQSVVFKRNTRRQRMGQILGVGAPIPSITPSNVDTYSDSDNVQELANFIWLKEDMNTSIVSNMRREEIAFSIVSKGGIKLQNLENELKEINSTNNSTSIYAPGLISKSRDQHVINNYIKDKRWVNPWTDDLPEDCCIALEPTLAKYEYDIQMEKLNMYSLRPSNYDSSVAVADVNGDLIDESDWEIEQTKSFSLFNNATRRLQPIEEQIQKWNSMFNNISKTSLRIQAEKSVLLEYNKRLNQIKNTYETDLSTLETSLEDATTDLSNKDNIVDAELVKASQNQLQALLEQIQDSRDAERDAKADIDNINEEIKDKEDDLLGATGAQQSQLENEIIAKKTELANAQKAADKAREKLKEKRRKRLEEEEKIRLKKEKELEDARFRAEENIRKREEAYKKQVELLEEQERKDVQSKVEEANRLERLIGKESKSFTLDFNEGLIDINEKNKTKTATDWIYPADLTYGGGYFTKNKPDIVVTPYGFYTMGNKKLWSGIRINELSDTPGFVKLYDENENLVEVAKKNVYPVLNDKIFIQGDTPTTSIKTISSANDSQKLAYFGLNNDEEQITFELPYKIGTEVGFTYKVPDTSNVPSGVYDKILHFKTNLNGNTNAFDVEKYSTGIIEEVHVINSKTIEKLSTLRTLETNLNQLKVDLTTLTDQNDIKQQNVLISAAEKSIKKLKAENGMFKNGEDFTSVLVATIRINDALVLENIPFKFLHRIVPLKLNGSTSVCYYDEFREEKRLGYTFASLLTNNDNMYIVVDTEIIKTNIKNVKPILENGTSVVFLDGVNTLVGEIESFTVPNYKIKGRGLVNVENVSILGDASTYKNEIAKRNLTDGWVESPTIANYIRMTSTEELKEHLDYIDGTLGLTRSIRLSNIKLRKKDLYVVPSVGDDMSPLLTINLEENKLKVESEVLTIDIVDTTVDNIVTSKGNIPWSSVEYVHVPTYAKWNNSAFTFVIDPTNKVSNEYIKLMVGDQKEFLIHSGTEGDSEEYLEESGWQSSWPQPKWATSSSSDEKELAMWASSSDTESAAWATSSVSGSVSGSAAWATSSVSGSVSDSASVNIDDTVSLWAESDSEDADDLSSIIAKLENPHSDVAAWATEDDD